MKPALLALLALAMVLPLLVSACTSEPAPAPPAKPQAGQARPTQTQPARTETAAPAATGTVTADVEPVKAEPAKPEPEEPELPLPEPKLVRTQWQSIYVGQHKAGYVAQNLYEFPDGGRRLQVNEFYKLLAGADKFGYVKTITADVDAQFRPRRLECQVISGSRQWTVKGRVAGNELVLTRKVGETTTKARIPITGDVTFLAWALDATALGGGQVGQTRRYSVIDESLGAVLPEPCTVQVVGPRSIQTGPNQFFSGKVLLWTYGLEQVAYVLGNDGRTVCSLWQSSPMLGVGGGLAEAQRTAEPADVPRGPDIPGFSASGYRSESRGFSLWVPPLPMVANASADVGAVDVGSLVSDAHLVVRLGALPQYGGSAAADVESARVADLLEREWAAHYEDVKASPLAPGRLGSHEALVTDGTVRLGCTTFWFRNYYIETEGRTYCVSARVADRPLSSEPILMDSLTQTLRLTAPEGPLPIQVAGDVIRSPFYGLELKRPGPTWTLPQHQEGPTAVLELVRQDLSAVAILRVLAPKPGQSVESFAADQATLAVENLDVAKPEPAVTTLAGRKAAEISYEGKKILSDRPARCTIVYTTMEDQMLALVLIAEVGAGDAAAKELLQIRESLKISAPAARPSPAATATAAAPTPTGAPAPSATPSRLPSGTGTNGH